MIRNIFEALRPSQWIKNLALLASVILNGKLFDISILSKSILAFFVFCLLSSSSYLVNDIVDLPKDKLHPYKKNRPIARGDLNIYFVISIAIFLLISGLFLSFQININFFMISILFISLQFLYSLLFKKKAVIDIIGIALFFIIRAYAGEIATGFHLPIWIILSVIFLSLFIASGKRRSELVNVGKGIRQSMSGYGKTLLNFYITMFGVCTLMSYAMFTFFEEKITFDGYFHKYFLDYFPNALDRKWYMITLFPVIFGIMRYGQVIFEMEEGERPERVIATDIPLLLSVITWGLMLVILIYIL